jgi:AcrR family transcriptional regulator
MSEQSTARPPARRGRPPGRSAQQEEQRKRNRAQIIAAAATVFADKPYAQATMDDIIAAAGISRATFYVHFESKLALAIEIYESIADSWFALFDELAAMAPLSIEPLKQWTLALARLYVDHGYVTPLVEQLALSEKGFRQRLAQDRDMVIARLANAGVTGCVAAMGSDRNALLQRTRLRLLQQRLDQVCGILIHADAASQEDADAYIEVMAEELLERLG